MAPHCLVAKLTYLAGLGALAFGDISTALPQVPHVPALLAPLLAPSAQMQLVNTPLCSFFCGGHITEGFAEEVIF